MKYLIIEENQKMIKIIEEIISITENSFVECTNVNEALSSYSNHLPDFVLLDIQINNMLGLDLLKRFHIEFPAAKIIIITDYDTPASRFAVTNEGALAFISKDNLFELKDYLSV